jgi:uncharacterized protein YeaO (DUF488 family)
MPVRTKRWNDPVAPDDGLRVLICRYRPRGVPTAGEPWDAWTTALAPSRALHAAAYGKDGREKLPFPEYERRFRDEMAAQQFWIDGFAKRVADGETVTLLCSSACTDEARCHRSLVKKMLEEAAAPVVPPTGPVRRSDIRRRA